MVACNKLHLLSHNGFVEEYAIEFQHLWSRITKFSISIGDKVERFLVGLKEGVRTKF